MGMVVIRNMEETVLLPQWIKQVINLHCGFHYNVSSNPITLELRKIVQGYEVDLILTCKKKNRTIRIGFELKTNEEYSQLQKAVKQSIERRALFHYFYIVIDAHTHDILAKLRHFREALKHGIGFISGKDNCIIIKSYGKAHWRESQSYIYTLLPYLNKDMDDNHG